MGVSAACPRRQCRSFDSEPAHPADTETWSLWTVNSDDSKSTLKQHPASSQPASPERQSIRTSDFVQLKDQFDPRGAAVSVFEGLYLDHERLTAYNTTRRTRLADATRQRDHLAYLHGQWKQDASPESRQKFLSYAAIVHASRSSDPGAEPLAKAPTPVHYAHLIPDAEFRADLEKLAFDKEAKKISAKQNKKAGKKGKGKPEERKVSTPSDDSSDFEQYIQSTTSQHDGPTAKSESNKVTPAPGSSRPTSSLSLFATRGTAPQSQRNTVSSVLQPSVPSS